MLNIWYPRDTKTPQGGPPSCITRVVSQLRSIQNGFNFAGYISNAFPSKKIYVPNFVVCWFIFSLQRNMYMMQWCRSHLLLGLKWLYWVRRILCSGRGCLKPPLSTKHNILNTCILDYKKVTIRHVVGDVFIWSWCANSTSPLLEMIIQQTIYRSAIDWLPYALQKIKRMCVKIENHISVQYL